MDFALKNPPEHLRLSSIIILIEVVCVLAGRMLSFSSWFSVVFGEISLVNETRVGMKF